MTMDRAYIVPGFHHDVAYLKRESEYLPTVLTIVDEALDLLAAEKEYRFNIEQSICLEDYWRHRPERREQLAELFRQGRLTAAPGMYVMPDMNLPTGESLFMQCLIGRRWIADHLGVEPRTCWIADCWGHPAQLPQILRQCGYDYYIFFRCMRPADVGRLNFRWRGLDGTTLNTHWSALSYSTMLFPNKAGQICAADQKDNPSADWTLQNVCDRLRQYGGSSPFLLFNSDDFMHPQASAIEAVRRFDADPALPACRFATPDEALDAVDFANTDELAGEFNSMFGGSWTSNILIKQRNRALSWRMLSAEAAAVVADKPLQEPAQTWRAILKQQFHDTICGTICDGALADALAEMDQAEKDTDRHLQAALPDSPDEPPRAFNPSGFDRQELVETAGSLLEIRVGALDAADLSSARPVVLTGGPRELPATFTNRFYTAKVGANGYLLSLKRAGSQVELVSPTPAPFGSLAMQMDYGDLWLTFNAPLGGPLSNVTFAANTPDPYRRENPGLPYNMDTFQPVDVTARVVRAGDGFLEIEQTGRMSFWRVEVPFITRIRLWADSPLIDYHTRLHTTGKNVRVRVAFPTTLAGGRIRHEIAFGIQQRPEGEFPAGNWIDLSGPSDGLGLLNAGTPAGNVTDGVMMLTLFRSVAMEYKTDSAAGYHLNEPHEFRYAILPHAPGHEADAELIRRGIALNQPLEVRRCARPGRTGWSLRPGHVILSALRHDDRGVFCRLYEAVGRETTAELTVPDGFDAWAPADGLQRPTDDWKELPRPLPLPLRAFEIRGLLLRPRPG